MPRVTIIVLLCFLFDYCGAQTHTPKRDTTIMVKLLTTGIPKGNKKIELLNTDSFTVYTTYENLISYLIPIARNEAHDAPFIINNKAIYWYIAKNKNKHINIDSFAKQKEYQHELHQLTSNLLERAQCFIYNKQRKDFEKILIISWFGLSNFKNNKPEGWNGRDFFIRNNKFHTELDGAW